MERSIYRRRRRDDVGFTLIELMIVVAIIANATKAIGALKAISTSQSIYRRKSSRYGDSLSALVIDGGLDSAVSVNAADYSGYSFTLIYPDPGTNSKWAFGAGATPVLYDASGEFTYYTNHRFTLWHQDFNRSANLGDFPVNGATPTTAAGWQITSE